MRRLLIVTVVVGCASPPEKATDVAGGIAATDAG
jgi:hypothetical protein